MVGAPASYLREGLNPDLAAQCLNHGLHETAGHGTDAVLLVRGANGKPRPIVRAATSDSYGRVWDADLYGRIASTFGHDTTWQLPPVWGGGVAGAYRGDRDSFLILTNGGSIVTDPSARGNDGRMFRGIMVRNSEVGAAAVTIDAILYRYICGNHMLWGAAFDQRFRRRHVGTKALRETIRTISDLAYRWTLSSTRKDEEIIRGLIDHEIAATKEAVIDELRGFGATKEQAEAAYARCEQTESVSPRSFWGIGQGLTRISQDAGYQDERYSLDKLAALVLARGAKLVRV